MLLLFVAKSFDIVYVIAKIARIITHKIIHDLSHKIKTLEYKAKIQEFSIYTFRGKCYITSGRSHSSIYLGEFLANLFNFFLPWVTGKTMLPYKNLGGNSGVVAYEIGNDYIIVQFPPGTYTLYTYTYSSAGVTHIENMKKYAIVGKGLHSYISTEKPKYSSKK